MSAAGWGSNLQDHTLTPVAGGATAVAHVAIPYGVRGWQVWIGGSFDRGLDVSVDGHALGRIADALDPIGAYEQVGGPQTLPPGTHTITVTYPGANLSPGNSDSEHYTSFGSIVLSPPASTAHLLRVAPGAARSLCGRLLDWVEVVAPA